MAPLVYNGSRISLSHAELRAFFQTTGMTDPLLVLEDSKAYAF